MKTKSKATGNAIKHAEVRRAARARTAGLRLYHTAWNGLRKGFLFQERLGEWHLLEHAFDEHITSTADAAVYVEALLKDLDDPFCRIYSPSETAFNRQSKFKAFGGIGADLRILGDGKFIIGKVTDGGAAHRVGLKRHAVVKSVDGNDTSKIAAMELGRMIRGPVGSPVDLGVLQDGEEKHLIIRRRAVSKPSVHHLRLPNGVGYIRIADFDKRTLTRDLSTACEELSDCRNIVIDVRGNRGGSNDLAMTAKALMLDAGLLVSWDSTIGTLNRTEIYLRRRSVETVTRRGRTVTRVKVARPKRMLNRKARICVLIDGETASNAELLAAVLDHRRGAFLVGEKTFGKAVSQVVYKLPDGYSMTFTFAKILASDGRWLGDGHERRFGVEPHKVVRGKGRIFKSSYKRDKQLQAACTHLLAL